MTQNIFIKKIAAKIRQIGLTAPAILFLEAHKPLAFIGSQLLLVAQPTLDLFLKPNFTQNAIDLLADPGQVEQLIVDLERGGPAPLFDDDRAEPYPPAQGPDYLPMTEESE